MTAGYGVDAQLRGVPRAPPRHQAPQREKAEPISAHLPWGHLDHCKTPKWSLPPHSPRPPSIPRTSGPLPSGNCLDVPLGLPDGVQPLQGRPVPPPSPELRPRTTPRLADPRCTFYVHASLPLPTLMPLPQLLFLPVTIGRAPTHPTRPSLSDATSGMPGGSCNTLIKILMSPFLQLFTSL